MAIETITTVEDSVWNFAVGAVLEVESFSVGPPSLATVSSVDGAAVDVTVPAATATVAAAVGNMVLWEKITYNKVGAV